MRGLIVLSPLRGTQQWGPSVLPKGKTAVTYRFEPGTSWFRVHCHIHSAITGLQPQNPLNSSSFYISLEPGPKLNIGIQADMQIVIIYTSCSKYWERNAIPLAKVNPNLPGLFCELKFLGGGAIMAPPPLRSRPWMARSTWKSVQIQSNMWGTRWWY